MALLLSLQIFFNLFSNTYNTKVSDKTASGINLVKSSIIKGSGPKRYLFMGARSSFSPTTSSVKLSVTNFGLQIGKKGTKKVLKSLWSFSLIYSWELMWF